MSHFVTFYSYKGGVGRTLALANIAWIIANERTEPARVLTIDFDLGAPGLFQVFGMTGSKSSPGIVDYVTNYLAKAAIPDVSHYIQRTPYRNIDILPAGQMNGGYQKRLEGINWKELYEGAFGYELVERLKADLAAIQPEYDYVLIDSLTGYSDIGGICVNQLPDSVVLLFRLNQQNLDGIGTVRRVLRRTTLDDRPKTIIPVITPSWPFLDDAAGKWISKAQRLFPEEKLFEITFDSSLSFGERIISKTASALPLTSKILTDYTNLAAQIRDLNPLDPLTMWKNIRSTVPSERTEHLERYLKLLQRRPRVLQYWMHFPSVSGMGLHKRSSTDYAAAMRQLRDFVNQQAEGGNKFALLARALAERFEESDAKQNEALNDLKQALEIDPSFLKARAEKARLEVERGRLIDAVQDFKLCLTLPKGEDEIARNVLEADLADAYLRAFKPDDALSTIESAIATNPSNLEYYSTRARALYLKGDYQAALVDAKRVARSPLAREVATLLPSQILAALGNLEEATAELDSIAKQQGESANLAEAYLAVNPRRSLQMLVGKGPLFTSDRAVRPLLVTLARILANDDISGIVRELNDKPLDQVNTINWNFFELVAMLRAKMRAAALSSEALEVALRVMRMTMGEMASLAFEDERKI